MSRAHYRTEAFILAHSPVGEANNFITLFTEELGLLRASAQGVRRLQSKLRFGLQDFSLVEVVLVRGKEIWRITNAVPKEGCLTLKRGVRFGRVSMLLRRLLMTEVPQKALFSLLSELSMLFRQASLSEDEVHALETIAVMRILSLLGYFSPEGDFKPYIESSSLEEVTPLSFLPLQSKAIALINKSLSETQL